MHQVPLSFGHFAPSHQHQHHRAGEAMEGQWEAMEGWPWEAGSQVVKQDAFGKEPARRRWARLGFPSHIPRWLQQWKAVEAGNSRAHESHFLAQHLQVEEHTAHNQRVPCRKLEVFMVIGLYWASLMLPEADQRFWKATRIPSHTI
eukprot:Skav229131  [mRNA]  locus=scaffold1875:8791:9228:+ [translate_table: standard]